MAKPKMYIAQEVSELIDLLVTMGADAPKFRDKTCYLSFINLEYRFQQLDGSLRANRSILGEESFLKLVGMAAECRTMFEADPEATTGQTKTGRNVLYEMETMLRDWVEPPDGLRPSA